MGRSKASKSSRKSSRKPRKRYVVRESGWSHLTGRRIRTNYRMCPPYPAKGNVGKRAVGMDGYMWEAKRAGKVLRWMRV